jgi:hypothetical protein
MDPLQLLRELLLLGLLPLGTEFREGVLEGFLLAAELGDPLRDQLRLDPPLEGGYLGLDLAVQFGDLLADPRACELAVAAPLAVVGAQLLVESGAWPAQQRTMPENK